MFEIRYQFKRLLQIIENIDNKDDTDNSYSSGNGSGSDNGNGTILLSTDFSEFQALLDTILTSKQVFIENTSNIINVANEWLRTTYTGVSTHERAGAGAGAGIGAGVGRTIPLYKDALLEYIKYYAVIHKLHGGNIDVAHFYYDLGENCMKYADHANTNIHAHAHTHTHTHTHSGSNLYNIAVNFLMKASEAYTHTHTHTHTHCSFDDYSNFMINTNTNTNTGNVHGDRTSNRNRNGKGDTKKYVIMTTILIGKAYYKLSRYAEGQKIFDNALELTNQLQPLQQQHVSHRTSAETGVVIGIGSGTGALYGIRTQTHAQTHAQTHTQTILQIQIYIYKSLILKELGKYQDSITLQEKALSISIVTLGANHIDNSEIYYNLYILYQDKKKYEKSLK